MASGVDPLDHDRSVYGCALYDDTSDHPGGRRKADTRLLESIPGKLPAGDSHTSDPDIIGVDDLYPFPECTGNGRTDPYGLLGRYLSLRNHMADGDIICLPCTGEVFQQYRKHHEECIPDGGRQCARLFRCGTDHRPSFMDPSSEYTAFYQYGPGMDLHRTGTDCPVEQFSVPSVFPEVYPGGREWGDRTGGGSLTESLDSRAGYDYNNHVQRMLCQVRIEYAKRESGVNPERSGHCIRRACFRHPIA